ncbi:MAG: ADP-ribosylglycohydrolase family protein, partial [Methanomassiliicoccales archaeon]
VGDALGLPVQFLSQAEIIKQPVTGMRGYGTFNLPPGSWSDDGSLTLCLAASLTESDGYDPADVGRRFIKWYDQGYLTPFGYAYDIGGTTSAAIEAMKNGVPPEQAGKSGLQDNGNGALMRIMPAILFGLARGEDHFLLADRGGALSHAHGISRTACVIYAQAIELIMAGSSKEEIASGLLSRAQRELECLGLAQWLSYYEILNEGAQLGQRDASTIASSGYVVDSLIAALWAFTAGESFADTVIMAVNLGEDTDTIGAIAGGLAGMFYGFDDIPDEWIQALQNKEMVDQVLLAFTNKYFPA